MLNDKIKSATEQGVAGIAADTQTIPANIDAAILHRQRPGGRAGEPQREPIGAGGENLTAGQIKRQPVAVSRRNRKAELLGVAAGCRHAVQRIRKGAPVLGEVGGLIVIEKHEFNFSIRVGERVSLVLHTNGINCPGLPGGYREGLPPRIANRRAVFFGIGCQQIGAVRIALRQNAFVRLAAHN